MSVPTPRVTLRNPTDVLAAVPYLLGFHPTDSVVVLGLSGTRVVFSARADLPPPDVPEECRAVIGQLGAVLAREGTDVALLLGYGADTLVAPVLLPFAEALRKQGVLVAELLRVDGGRYWSYLCAAACCPPEGRPFDATGTEIAAVATYRGQVVLSDRAALERSVAPVTGAARAAADVAVERAAHQLATEAGGADRRTAVRAIARALRRYADGGRLTDAELARLTLLLTRTDVRDLAWRRVAEPGVPVDSQLDLWRDVTRWARDDLVAAPATLLGYAAWRCGDGALARVAVDRALAADPGYPLARLLSTALDRAVPAGRD